MKNSTDKPAWNEVEGQSTDVKSLWNEWQRLTIKDDILHRHWTSIDGSSDRLQIVLPIAYRTKFIHLSHTGITGGHLGRSKTEDQVRRRAYWPNWRTQVAEELRRCPECAQYHRGKAPTQTPLQPFIAGEFWETIPIDITGRHPKSQRGNEYILTVVDHFTKWAEAFPIRSHTATVIVKVLMDHLFSRFGFPKCILTDQGVEFQGEIFTQLCEKMEIDKVRTSAYKPSTNACVERFHRTLNSMLAKTVLQSQRNWDDCIPYVVAAYRAARHDSTGYSPNQLVLSRKNRAPVDLVLGTVPEEASFFNSYNEYVVDLQHRVRRGYELAREHLGLSLIHI